MSIAIDSADILIRMLPTPNPYAVKFVLNQPIKRDGKATFQTAMEAQDLPLIRDLFGIAGVKQVHAFQNTMTITHSGDVDDSTLNDAVDSVVRTRLPSHNADFQMESEAQKPRSNKTHENPVLQQIEEILDRTIRPGLQADGGDIEVMQFVNDELQILYQGACGGCPSSMMGTLDAIQGILRHELNNEKIVVTPV
jgi:NFU1 iron-sulfur cluster scaffold homolog, mitochondrial